MLLLLASASTAEACSLAEKTGKLSDWLDDKIVFWGFPLESRWDDTRTYGSPAGTTLTTIDVVKPLKGHVSGQVKVYHHQNSAACGHNFPLGEMDIIILPDDSQDDIYTSSSYYFEQIDPVTIWAFLMHNIDVDFKDLNKFYKEFYSGEETSCDDNGNENVSYCNWIDTRYSITKKWTTESNELRKFYIANQ